MGTFLSNKNHLKTTIMSIIVNDKALMVFCLIVGTRQVTITSISKCTGSSSQCSKARKRNYGCNIG